MRDCNNMSIEQIMAVLRLDEMWHEKMIGDYFQVNNKRKLKIELDKVNRKKHNTKK